MVWKDFWELELADTHFYNGRWCGFSLSTVIAILAHQLRAGTAPRAFPIGSLDAATSQTKRV